LIWLNPLAALASLPDTVIFDIDGVLIDVKKSFRRSIVKTVQFVFTRFFNLDDTGLLVTQEDIAHFKRAGGFNNDWELTFSLVAILSAHLNSSVKTTADLRALVSLSTFSGTGGLAGVLARFSGKLPVDYETVKRIFQEVYWGQEELVRRLKIRPQYVFSSGLVKQERVLAPPDLLDALEEVGISKFGLITGRIRAEVEAALEKLPFRSKFAPESVITGEEIAKPNPASLERLARSLGTSSGLYIGDTADDCILVKNFNRHLGDGVFLDIIVARRSDWSYYRSLGAGGLLSKITLLPELVSKTRALSSEEGKAVYERGEIEVCQTTRPAQVGEASRSARAARRRL